MLRTRLKLEGCTKDIKIIVRYDLSPALSEKLSSPETHNREYWLSALQDLNLQNVHEISKSS